MIQEYALKLTPVATRARQLIATLKRGAKTKEQKSAVTALEAKALRERESIYGLECVIRQAHTVAFVHNIELK